MPSDTRTEGRNNRLCSVCGQAFSKPEHLQRHVRSHTKERPFTCRTCGKSFARSDVRKRHEKAHATRVEDAGSAGDVAITPATSTEVGRQSHAGTSNTGHTLDDGAGIDLTTDWLEPLDSSVSLDDFDFGSLDSFLNDVMTDWVQGTNNSQYYYDPSNLAPPVAQQSRSRTPNTDAEGGPLQSECVVDQQYSNDISRQLGPVQQQFDTTYSTEYLNLCLQMYFAHFHPIFPVVHRATFRPRSYNILLSISMCSIGSLFIGSPEATVQGHQLYARLNKAILASWETHLSEPKPSTLPIAQAALLGQTFGLLSGKSADRFMTEVFQGTMLAWARKIEAFDTTEQNMLKGRLSVQALSRAWKAWVKVEERRRFGLALYIHDAEIADLFQRHPILRHQHITYSAYATDDVFEAPTAEDWQNLYLDQKHHTSGLPTTSISDWLQQDHEEHLGHSLTNLIQNSSFAAYAILANVGAHIMELVRPSLLASTDVHALAQGLLRWYSDYIPNIQSGLVDLQCLRVLYHQYSLLLYADLTLLERAMGVSSKQKDVEAARQWTKSSSAACAMLHACLLQKHASEIKLGTIPPIHLPRAIFNAGVVFTAFNRFLGFSNSVENVDKWKLAVLNMPGATSISQAEAQPTEQMASWICDVLSQRMSTMPYTCINLLRKLTHWGVADVFAETLERFIRHPPEFSSYGTSSGIVQFSAQPLYGCYGYRHLVEEAQRVRSWQSPYLSSNDMPSMLPLRTPSRQAFLKQTPLRSILVSISRSIIEVMEQESQHRLDQYRDSTDITQGPEPQSQIIKCAASHRYDNHWAQQ